MKCPYCNEELNWEDYYWQGHNRNKKGDIYRCKNSEGFETVEEAMSYINVNSLFELHKYLAENNMKSWEEITCESGIFNVCGSFYTNEQDELLEGYPC